MFLRLQKKYARKSSGISVHRQIIQTTEPISFGISRERAGWWRRENCLCRRSKKSERRFRRIWKSRHLSMGRCAYPIPDAACSAIILPAEMLIKAPVRTHAAGNMQSWRRRVRENTCRCMKTKEERIFLIPKICV